MLNRKILLLSILFVSLLAVSAVSAADNVADDIGIDDTNDDKIVLKENTDYDESEIIAEPDDGTFTSLQDKVSSAQAGSTIKFENNYTNDEEFSSEGIEIKDKTDLTVDGNGFTIDAKCASRIFYVENSSVVFKNIIFVNGKVEDGEGGAIYFNGGKCLVSNCTFINNSADSCGGAISFWTPMLSSSNVEVYECNFTDNLAESGGAVFLAVDNATISKSIFSNNSAYYDGGAISCGEYQTIDDVNWICLGFNGNIFECNFTNNLAVDGGAIYWQASKGTVSNSKFTRNFAYDGQGGAIGWYGSDGAILNCNFTDNLAFREDYYTYGGAIYMSGNNVNISDSVFKNNSADYGGAIASVEGEDEYVMGYNVTVSGCNFTENHANDGGAIYCTLENGTVSNSIFSNNSAEGGGAISWSGNNGKILKSAFNDNSASGGGAIYCSGQMFVLEEEVYAFGVNVTVSECNFTNNSAEYIGGAILWSAINGTVSKSNFNENHANDGGAIYWGGLSSDWDSSLYGAVEDCNFIGNYADSCGGAICWNEDEGVISNSIFNNNYVIAEEGGSGGAVSFNSINGMISHSSFNNNSARCGGAISCVIRDEFLMLESNITVMDCNFTNNFAEIGGAIDWPSGNVSDSIFENNIATYYAGAISTEFKLSVSNSRFLNNKVYSEPITETNPFTFKFEGDENYIHAIFSEGDVIFSNVIYWNGNVVNSDEVTPLKNIYPGINITIEVYSNENLVENVTLVTNDTSEVQYDPYHLDDGEYKIIVYHADDSYYFGSEEVFEDTFILNRNSSSVKINIADKDEFIYPDCNISFTVINRTQVRVVITDKDGLVLVNESTDENYTIVTLDAADDYYNITVYNAGTQFYAPSKDSKLFKITKLDCNVVVTADEVVYGSNTTINLTADVDGNYTLDISGRLINVTVSNGKGNVSLALPAGSYYANATYNNVSYATNASNAVFKVLKVILDAKDVKYAGDNKHVYKVKLLDEKGLPVSGSQVIFTINGKASNATTDSQGIASVTIDALNVGSYEITISNNLSGSVSKKINVIPTLETHDLVMDYDKGSFVVRAFDENGNPAVNQIVEMTVNGILYKKTTDADGYAKLLIQLRPDNFVITSKFRGQTFKNTIKVKSTLKVKKAYKAKVTKKLVLTAKLRWSNGKPIAGAKILFKFKGKKYYGTVQKNGVAKVIISNAIIKNLNPKKKYLVKFAYKNETAKAKVKIKA